MMAVLIVTGAGPDPFQGHGVTNQARGTWKISTLCAS
jgi:hypothetical protein